MNNDTPIYEGAHSRHQLGERSKTAEFLIESVRRNPGEISLLAIGPLTNVATAMELDPGFAGGLHELVVMGGALDCGWISRIGEFNFNCDAVSAARVFSDPVAKTLMTMDVVSHAVFRRPHLDRLRRSDGPIARYLAGELQAWLSLSRLFFPRTRGFYPRDPVAAAFLTRPELFDANPYRLDVATRGLGAGRVGEAKRLSSFDPQEGRIPVNLPLQLDGEAFMEELLGALLSFDQPQDVCP